MDGWIKIHRKILSDPLYFAEPFTRMQAFLDLVLLANHAQSVFFKRGIKIVVERSQVYRSENELAERWKWSRGKVRRFLSELENDQKIVQQKSRLCNCISVVNYDKYQVDDTTDGTTNSTTDSTTDGTTKYKNVEEEYIISSTTSTAHAHEEETPVTVQQTDGIDGDIARLRGSPLWLEQILMKHKVAVTDLDTLFSEFAAECRCNGLERHVDLNDAKRHFNSWLRIYKHQNQQNGATNKPGYRPSPSENIAAAQREELERTAALLRSAEGGH